MAQQIHTMHKYTQISEIAKPPLLLKPKLMISAIFALTAAGYVQAEEQAQYLETIRVLGQAEEGYNVALTDDIIEARQASDLADLLRHDPSITVGGGAPVAQKIYVRGLEDTLLNVTIDGATQAGYLYHHQGRVHVEPELIKDIVIKPGAGNAADGAGALGGAIHFNLKDAQDMLRPGETSGLFVKSGFFSNNDGWKNHLSAYGLLTDKIGLLASVTHYESNDDYEDGLGNKIDETEQLQKDARIKLSGDIADGHYFSISYETYEDEGKRYARPNMGALFHPVYQNVPVDQRTERESWTGNYTYNPESQLVDLSTTLYYTDSTIEKRGDLWLASSFPPFPPGPPTLWPFADYYNGAWHGGGVESRGFDIRNTSLFGAHTLEYGFEYRDDEAYLINPSVAGFDEEETEVRALFIQADLELTDSLRLSTGARYDDYDYTDNNGVNIKDDAISPNATFSFDVNESLEISLGYAKAFKGVSSPEVFFLELPPNGTTLASYMGPDTTGAVSGATLGLGELKAEESDNSELGFKYDAGNFAASGEIYRQTIKNAQYTSTTTRYSYLDDVEVEGYALRMAYYWDSLALNAGVSHSKPELDGEPLSSGDMGLGTAYGRTWTLGLEYDYSPDILLGWDARFVERLTDVRSGQDEKAGYGVHDVFVQWAPNDDLTLGLAINNLFDKFYYDQGTFYSRDDSSDPYGLPEPGRDIRVYASYKF